MIRFLIHIGIALATAALALLICSWILTDFNLQPAGFVFAVVVFTAAQAILAPFILNIARTYASALLGGIGLISTFVALLIADLVPNGLEIRGIVTWILAALIIWVVTALGTWLLPMIFLKNRRGERTA